MRISAADRNWLLAGGLAAAVLVAIGWFFVISPQGGKTTSLKSQTTDTQSSTLKLRHNLEELRADSANLPKYKAQLAADQQALPATSGMPDFLRELQTIGSQTGVAVNTIGVNSPVAVAAAEATAAPTDPTATTSTATGTPHAASSGLYSVVITVAATGSLDGLTAFLQQMQQVQPRAVLVVTTTEAPAAAGGDQITLSMGLQLFIAPNTATVPTVAATASN